VHLHILRNIGVGMPDNNHKCLRNGFATSFSNGWNALNFVETMFFYTIVPSVPHECMENHLKFWLLIIKTRLQLKIKKCVTKKVLHRCCLKRFSVDNNLRLTEDKNYLTIYSPLEKDKHKTSGTRTSANFPLNHLDYWGESMLAHYTNCHLLKIKAALRHKRF
jgi:hypothetical protein